MEKLKQTILAAAVLGMLVLGTAGIVLSQDEQTPDSSSSGDTMENMTGAPAPLSPESIPPAL